MYSEEESVLALPPQALEAERGVLGSILISDCFDDVAAILQASDFYHGKHQQAFEIFEGMAKANHSIDVVTAAEWAAERNIAEIGLSYFGDLAKNTPNAGNVSAYSRTVKERSRRRSVIEEAQALIADAYQTQTPVDALIDRVANFGSNISIDNGNANENINSVLAKTVDAIEAQEKAKSHLIGLSTGLTDLDRMTRGLQGGKLYIIAARPSHGKTTLAMNMAEHNALEGKTAQVFTMEMTKEEIGMKLLSSVGRVDYDKVQSAQLSSHEWPQLTSATGLLRDKKLFIDDSTAMTMAQIKSRSRKVKKQHGLDLVIVDYLGLMEHGEGERHDLELAKITRAMKNMAKDFMCPVVLVVQCNRKCEARSDKRPTMQDLKDAGSIEQDANVVIMVYRDEVYDEDSRDVGVAELIFRKNRGGKIGTVRALFNGEHQRFDNFAPVARMQEYRK